MEIKNESDYFVTGVLISSIAIFFVTTLIGVCCKKKKKNDVTKPTTTTVSKDSKATLSQKVAKDYPRAPPIKNPPLAPAREDDDTLRNVQSLKKDDHS
uniref:Uncharacterized protein n=1 Tax=Panagrolaimus sp. PS1159 TaxID=55785 RepID=A0AC35FIE0_9BILA